MRNPNNEELFFIAGIIAVSLGLMIVAAYYAAMLLMGLL